MPARDLAPLQLRAALKDGASTIAMIVAYVALLGLFSATAFTLWRDLPGAMLQASLVAKANASPRIAE